MKLLLVLAAVIILAIAQTPCESPPLWQAKAIEFDPSQAFARRSDIFYDEANARLALYDDTDYKGRETYTFDLFLFNRAKYYSLNLQTQACTIGPLNGTFPVIEVPPGSNYTGQYYIGLEGVPNDYLLVNRFEDYNGNYLGSWTALGCAPVAAYVNTTNYGSIFFNFVDVQLGISDPNIFNIPRQCS